MKSKISTIFTKNKYKIIISAITMLLVIGTSVYLGRKSISLVIDGKQKNLITYRSTVQQVLKSEGIDVSPNDELIPALNSKIKNNETITLKHAVAVQMTIDGVTTTKYSPEDNIESFLTAEGIVVNAEDKVTPEKSTKLFDGIKINIVKVEHKTILTKDIVAFRTVTKRDSSLPNTHVQTVQNGSDGEKEVTSDVVYEDGKETSRKILSETVTKKPVDKILVVGTFPLMPVSRGGQELDYKKVIKVKATAYYAVYGVGKTYTATGVKAVRNPEGYSTIAVDPRVIPYGTKLFVEGYGFATAADAGTAIRGNWIDVFFDTYSEACRWSVKYVNVYIL
ncbi:MAG: G5 domain-containing protein [Bacillota bacterium]|nr:G5 domain-containing protein [Bacillota bacterium]